MSREPTEPAAPAKTRKLAAPAEEPRPAAGCALYVCKAGQADLGKAFRFTAGEAVIGRDPTCQLVLSDESVSRQHTRVRLMPEGIVVEDLGSTNGTTYLGKRIGRAVFGPGVRFAVGGCEIDLLPATDAAIPLSTRQGYGELIGLSQPMRRLYAVLEMLERSEAPVLLEGETGTGKELFARAIHQHSVRAKRPFVIIDCGNVQADLVASELFGHRRGAFTGAIADRAGAFEAADGGTVFLDELDELPLELQPNLLRVLETGQVKRLGDSAHSEVNVRILAATKRDLRAATHAGRFRADLYYRLSVVSLRIPPLRERPEDIPTLIGHLAGQLSKGKVPSLPPEATEMLCHHAWPGNVRELRNAVHRTLTLGVVSLDPAGPAAPEGLDLYSRPLREARGAVLQRFERDYLTVLLRRCDGNITAVARAADLDRKYLRELLKKYGLYDLK